MLKMNLGLACQSLKNSMKFFKQFKVDQNILLRDIATELDMEEKKNLETFIIKLDAESSMNVFHASKH